MLRSEKKEGQFCCASSISMARKCTTATPNRGNIPPQCFIPRSPLYFYPIAQPHGSYSGPALLRWSVGLVPGIAFLPRSLPRLARPSIVLAVVACLGPGEARGEVEATVVNNGGRRGTLLPNEGGRRRTRRPVQGTGGLRILAIRGGGI